MSSHKSALSIIDEHRTIFFHAPLSSVCLQAASIQPHPIANNHPFPTPTHVFLPRSQRVYRSKCQCPLGLNVTPLPLRHRGPRERRPDPSDKIEESRIIISLRRGQSGVTLSRQKREIQSCGKLITIQPCLQSGYIPYVLMVCVYRTGRDGGWGW